MPKPQINNWLDIRLSHDLCSVHKVIIGVIFMKIISFA